MRAYRLIPGLMLALALAAAAPIRAEGIGAQPEVRAFIDRMVAEHGFERGQLTALFDRVEPRPDVVAAISRPAESKPWYQYRPIFLTPERIRRGTEFRRDHDEILTRAHQVYGVPPEIITAILGVETFYGRQAGSYRVLDSLATLAFGYPQRSAFFLGELEQYLLLTREEQLDPWAITGSYAGAMGTPQFIASSYRRYAVDFDGDHHRDIWNNTADAIGSVAYYFNNHGWQPDQPIAARVSVDGDRDYGELLDQGLKPQIPIGELRRRYGIGVPEPLSDSEPAALIRLEDESGPEYWVGMQNFYAITRYNHSPLYAMAVFQLSEEIRARYESTIAKAEQKAKLKEKGQ